MSGSWDNTQSNSNDFSALLGDVGQQQGNMPNGNIIDMFANWVAAGYDSGMSLNGVV